MGGGLQYMSPREPRTYIPSHAVLRQAWPQGTFPKRGHTEVTGAAQVPRHSAHRPVHRAHSAPATGSQGGGCPILLSGQPALTGSPQHRIPLPCLKPTLVVVGLSRPGPSSHNAGAPGTASHTWACTAAGEGGEGRDGRVGVKPPPQEMAMTPEDSPEAAGAWGP